MLLVCIFKLFGDTKDFLFFLACELNPLVLHGLGEADLGQLGTNLRLNIALEHLDSDFEGGGVLEFGGSRISVARTFGGKFYLTSLDDVEDNVFVDEQTLEGGVHLGVRHV